MIQDSRETAKQIVDWESKGYVYWMPPDELRSPLSEIEKLPLLRGAMRIVDETFVFNNRIKSAHVACQAYPTSKCKACREKSNPSVFKALDNLINSYVTHCLKIRGRLKNYDQPPVELVSTLSLTYRDYDFRIGWGRLLEGAQLIAETLGYSPQEATRRAVLFAHQYVENVVQPHLAYMVSTFDNHSRRESASSPYKVRNTPGLLNFFTPKP